MQDSTKNKMAEILKAAQDKANQKMQPKEMPAPLPKVAEPEPKQDRPEMSNITISDLLNEPAKEDTAFCNVFAFNLPQTREQAKSANDGLELIEYSDRAICIIGNTKPVKEQLKGLGGKFNNFLTVNGQKVAGWIFPKWRANDVKAALSL